MTIRVFGKGDDVALPFLYPTGTPLGSEVSYTHPSYDWFYSKHGFAVPTNYESIPYGILMDNQFPADNRAQLFKSVYDYFLIDRRGNTWIVNVCFEKDKNDLDVAFFYIFRDDKGWWFNRSNLQAGLEADILLGTLTTNPSIETVNRVYSEVFNASRLSWFSISDIVAKLDRDFPLEVLEESIDKEKDD